MTMRKLLPAFLMAAVCVAFAVACFLQPANASPYSIDSYTGTGTQTAYAVTFPYISQTDVKVTINGSLTAAYTWTSPSQITFTTAPPSAATVVIQRFTQLAYPEVTFRPGSLASKDLNIVSLQMLYLHQERTDAPSSGTYLAVNNNLLDIQSPAVALNNLSGLPHVANNTALAALTSTTFAVVVRDGFLSAADAPPLTFHAGTTACSLNAGAGDGGSQVPSVDGKCWIAQFVGLPDIREWGAKADNATDNGPSGTNAFALAGSAHVGPIWIPADVGCFLVASPTTFSGVVQPLFVGGGSLEYNNVSGGNDICATTTPQGSWIRSSLTSGSPFTYANANQTGVVGFEKVAFTEHQPVPTSGWAPTAFSPIVYVQATGGEFWLHDVYWFGVTNAIDAVNSGGVNGRLNILNNTGQVFGTFLQADGLEDDSYISYVKLWPYMTNSTYVLAYQQLHSIGLNLLRTDGFIIGGLSIEVENTCIYVDHSVSSPGGDTHNLSVGSLYCDQSKYALATSAATSGADIEIATIIHNGGAIPGSIAVYDLGTGNHVHIGNLVCESVGRSCAQQAGTDDTLMVANAWGQDYNKDNGSYPMLNAGTGNVLDVAQAENFAGANSGGPLLACPATSLCKLGFLPSVTLAVLSAELVSPLQGQRAFITDAVACSFGNPPTGGGSTPCAVVWNGFGWVGG